MPRSTLVYEAGMISGGALLVGPPYRLNYWYVEFQNLVDPEDAVSAPAVDGSSPGSGVAYYEGLASSPDRDYLRIPIRSLPVIGQAAGFGSGFFGPGQGNQFRLVDVVTGAAGRHGKPFGSTNGSKVYGFALACAVDDNPANDLVHTRTYFDDGSEQYIVPANAQVVLTQVIDCSGGLA